MVNGKRYRVQVKARGTSVYAGIYWTASEAVARQYAKSMLSRQRIIGAQIVDEHTGYTFDVTVDKRC